MSLPESMSRIVIVGSKSHIDETISALYGLGAVHLIDHTNGSDEGFSIGAPRPYSSKASERLLAIKAAEKDLDINPKKAKTETISASDVEAQISSNGVETVQKEVFAAIDEKNKIGQKITDLKAKQHNLALLSKLPINLELYSNYDSLAVFVGTVKSDPSKELESLAEAETFSASGKDAHVVAVFIKKTDKDKASNILSQFGYSEIPVPAGTGAPADMLSSVESDIAAAETELQAATDNVAALNEKYKGFIVASDEELSLTVKMGETPLRIATSDFSFVIDAWIQTSKIDEVQAGLKQKLGNTVYVEVEETRGRKEADEEAAEPRFKKAPSKWNNGAYGKHFEYAVSLVSVPKYQEIDPSTIMGIFFPFFFGFMVGDVGYAIPFIVLGLYGLLTAKSKDFQSIATVLFFGGIWAFIFGFFFFGEMLGMHFIQPTGEELSGVASMSSTWEGLLHINLPDWFSGIMFDGHGVGKLEKVPFLLKLSVYIGIVHLMVAYFVGFVDAYIQKGVKEAYLEKGGWMITLMGMVIFCYALTELLFAKPPVGGTILDNLTDTVKMYMIIGAVMLVIGTVSSYPKDGVQAFLELPGIVGNILSYTRLAAIGMSKAGMALAFNYISIIMLGSSGDIIGIVFGCLVFIVGHLMIWTLAILSAGLHGLRLQYVEMMNKFFVGGGQEFDPLAIKRKHTKVVETEG